MIAVLLGTAIALLAWFVFFYPATDVQSADTSDRVVVQRSTETASLPTGISAEEAAELDVEFDIAAQCSQSGLFGIQTVNKLCEQYVTALLIAEHCSADISTSCIYLARENRDVREALLSTGRIRVAGTAPRTPTAFIPYDVPTAGDGRFVISSELEHKAFINCAVGVRVQLLDGTTTPRFTENCG
jgi:hypothetical protein